MPPVITSETPPQVGSPEWWLLRLLRRLEARQPRLRTWQRYYDGVQPMSFASSKFREAFGDRFPAFSSNFTELVVEGIAERHEVQGFRGVEQSIDDEAWALWQDNDLDAGSQQAFAEALIKGASYMLLEPGEGRPTITIEDALDTIVEADPRSRRRRRAGLKRWIDDSGQLMVVVYLPDGVYKYRTAKRWADEYQAWDWGEPELEPGEFTEGTLKLWNAAGFEAYQAPEDTEWPLSNPYQAVPLIELPNRPKLRGGGRSEVASIRSNQDAVNKYRTDALVASEFAAFPQRYLLNYETEVDDDTGRAKEPFRAGIDRLWTVPPPDPEDPNAKEPKFGQFTAADLAPYQLMIGVEVGHISSISRIPYHYLLGTPQTVPPSGESLKASEAGLEKKVARGQVFFGEGLEEVMRLGLGRTERTSETIWRDSETRNEAVRTDAIVKLHAEGIIDDELAWEMAGLTPRQMKALKVRMDAKREAEKQAATVEAERIREEEVAAAQAAPIVAAPTGPRMGAG